MNGIIGSQIAGRFDVKSRLGSGAHASVYLAYDAVRKAEVAVKIFEPSAFDTVTAEAAAQFRVSDCSAVMPLLDVLPDLAEAAVTVMPIARGGTLADPDDTLASRAIDAARAVSTALDFCHARGVTHGDVKPGNVFVAGDGTLRLGDFGIADFIPGGHRGHTPEYASPELVAGQARTPSDDVWATGVTLYELLTGELPFGSCEEQSEDELAARIAAGAIVAPDHQRPFLPQRLRRVFEGVFAPDPADRTISTPTALHDALADVPLRAEWVRIKGSDGLEAWEGHEIDAEGHRTGTVYAARIEHRPQKGHYEVSLKRRVEGGTLRQPPGLSLEPGSEAQAKQRLHTAMRRISAGQDPRG